jgi:pimeloyl-ACP methyl ester carboxylesterase
VGESDTLTLALNGRIAAALTWGPQDGPLALLLHGFPDSARTWRHLGPYLVERGWYAVAPYLRGYAPSSLASDGSYQVGALARDAIELRDALRGDERTVIIGHDWGSMAACGASNAAPEKFAAVVLLAVPPLAALVRRARPGPRLLRSLPVWLQQLPRSWYMAAAQVPLVSERLGTSLITLLWRRWAPGYEHDADLRAALEALPTVRHRRAALAYYRALWNPLYRSARYRREQRQAHQPMTARTLYLHGAADKCVRPDLGAAALDVLPEGSIHQVIPGAGHFLHLERPELVNRQIADFLAAGE